jgi:hypothetical protein
MFNCAIIRDMGQDEEISEQMQRLYQAAFDLQGIKGQSNVARFLNMSPQNLRLWEKGRPISYEGLVRAQETIGCDAVWLRDGAGSMARGGAALTDYTDVTRLITLFAQSTVNGRKQILRMAETAEKLPPR